MPWTKWGLRLPMLPPPPPLLLRLLLLAPSPYRNQLGADAIPARRRSLTLTTSQRRSHGGVTGSPRRRWLSLVRLARLVRLLRLLSLLRLVPSMLLPLPRLLLLLVFLLPWLLVCSPIVLSSPLLLLLLVLSHRRTTNQRRSVHLPRRHLDQNPNAPPTI